ncbi:MAG: 3-carboxymuconate cyclase [Pseudomonadales bacterium]|nr:3-carboxymuconate cyclase [Pseudomonadales bacterium]HAG94448.1 3-carboxymuconate cyclase [Gammaproteobacteria bacterium]HAU14401.1 3-carboxymuconate cyclase [Gammaproteobacteria bacterium]HBO93642.1 3-carboxymuconate cyclase [Gammaproteobacteria bacterium]|tara:strand:+ start:304 stop:1413 length:1110 start_codon:yes stop_codon:yes gene_type:complete
MIHKIISRCLSTLLLLGSVSLPAFAGHFSPSKVFTMTNSPEGNEVLMFTHHPYQGLIPSGSFATGGNGTGSGLGNQGAVVISKSGHWLFVVNAGSNSLSLFKVGNDSITLLTTVDTAGERPVSVTQHKNKVFVLNAGSDSIAGFKLMYNGSLELIENSVRSLSGSGVGAAQISFTPWGDGLLVTEKATNLITSFTVSDDGVPGEAIVNESAGATPFGFAFDRYGHAIVSEADGGAADASSLSSYRVNDNGSLSVLASAVPTTETAACWVVMSANGRTAFTTNAGSSSISAFKVKRNGSLTLTTQDGVAGFTGEGSAPIDMALSDNGKFLYTLSASDGSIAAFLVLGNRLLVPVPGINGLPTGMNGLAAF